ncbi:MAG TPA: cytochrome c [Acidimicrobiia bacterium]|nr:cytochrome c [Acidimicrobiia bacterium]
MQTELRRLLVTGLVTLGLAGATWAAFQSQPDPPVTDETVIGSALDGRTVFLTKGCTGCHSRDGEPGEAAVGPDLTDLAARAGSRIPGLKAEEYVRQSLLEPQAFLVEGYSEEMPTLALSANEIELLIEFLLSD